MSDDVLVSQLLANHQVARDSGRPLRPDLAHPPDHYSAQPARAAGGASCGVSPTQVLGSLPSSFVDEQVQDLANQVALGAPGRLLPVDRRARALLPPALVRIRHRVHQLRRLHIQGRRGRGPLADRGRHPHRQDGHTQADRLRSRDRRHRPAVVDREAAGGALSQPYSPPTGTTTKYLILFVTARNPTPFDKVRTLVAQSLLNSGSSKTTKVLTAAGAKAEVTADPRYGQVRPLSVDLAAPVSPASEFVPDASANLPLAQQLRGQRPRRQRAPPPPPPRAESGGRVRAQRAGSPVPARITVVGLGPAGPELRSAAADRRWLGLPGVRAHPPPPLSRRPGRHGVSFDRHYDEAPAFEDVYRRIVDDLVAAAAEGVDVTYAVPGLSAGGRAHR